MQIFLVLDTGSTPVTSTIFYFLKNEVRVLAKIISITNQKGGVGKTTTAINLSSYLVKLKKKVLLIDLDTQGNATTGLGYKRSSLTHCIYNVLVGQIPAKEAIMPVNLPGFFLIPSTIELAGAEVELVNIEQREFQLKQALQEIKSDFDYIILDCPPSLGIITVNALSASDSVIVPLQCEYYALEGLTSLLNTLTLVQRRYNKDLKIEGILLTMYDSHTSLSQQVCGEVINYFKNQVFKTIIPRNVRLSEAPSYGKSILNYDPSCRGADAYKALAEEIISHE